MATRTLRVCDAPNCTDLFAEVCPLCGQDRCVGHTARTILLLSIGLGDPGEGRVQLPGGALGISICSPCADRVQILLAKVTYESVGGVSRTIRPLDRHARDAVASIDLITVVRALLAGAALGADGVEGQGEG